MLRRTIRSCLATDKYEVTSEILAAPQLRLLSAALIKAARLLRILTSHWQGAKTIP